MIELKLAVYLLLDSQKAVKLQMSANLWWIGSLCRKCTTLGYFFSVDFVLLLYKLIIFTTYYNLSILLCFFIAQSWADRTVCQKATISAKFVWRLIQSWHINSINLQSLYLTQNEYIDDSRSIFAPYFQVCVFLYTLQ